MGGNLHPYCFTAVPDSRKISILIIRVLADMIFEALSQRVKRNLELQGYPVELKITFRDAFCASLRFPGLLHDSGISGHRDEKLLIQIDTEPQGVRYNPDKFILNKFDVFSRINIVPVDILAAQKIFVFLAAAGRWAAIFLMLFFCWENRG